MANSRIRTLLAALLLSIGMLFISSQTVYAEGEPEPEPVPSVDAGGQNPDDGNKQDDPVLFSVAPSGNSDNSEAPLADEIIQDPSDNVVDFGDAEIDEPVTQDTVEEYIQDAQIDEAIAGAVGIVEDPQIAINEGLAIAEGEVAKDALEEANQIIENVDNSEAVVENEEIINEYAGAANDAAEATSADVIAQSDEAVDHAQDALEDAKNAEYHYEAQAAADEAKNAYEKAQTLYNNAKDAVDAAQAKKDAAEAAYEEAKQAYEAAVADAKEALEEGKEALDYAARFAYEAYSIASENYDAAEQELNAAKEALDAADAKLAEDRENLSNAIDALGEAIVGSTSDILKNVGETTITGIGYGIADLVADYYDFLVEYKEGKIEELQDSIAASERQLAVELQRRLNEDPTLDIDRRYVQFTLAQLIIRDLHRNEKEDITSFVETTDINGVDISENLPEGHKKVEGLDNMYILASDEDGHSYYYELQFGDELKIYPIIYSDEPIESSDVPSVDEILEGVGSFLGVKLNALPQYYVETENSEGEPAAYSVYGLEYFSLIRRRFVQTYALPKSGIDFQQFLAGVVYAISTRNYDAISDYAILTQSLDNERFKLFLYTMRVGDEIAFDDHGLEPLVDDMQKEVNGLITEYELSVLSARDEISTLKEELYGNNLNQFIQSGLAGFVENNIDKIAEFAESDKEYPDFWDTVTASVSNIDWTEVLSGDSFLDIISNATDSIRTSITEGITSYLSGVVSASLPPLTDIFFYDYSSFGTDSFGGFISELVNNIEGLNILELTNIIYSISSGNLDENTINMLRDMLQIELPDATKKAIADAARILMGRLHEDAYNELKESVGEGRTSIIDALDQTGEAVKALASDSLDYLKKLTDVAEAEIKERYSWFVVEKTWDALSSAFDAYEAYYEYSENFTPAKLIELEETLDNAKAEVKDAKKALRTLQKNAEKAEKAYTKAQEIANSIIDYDIWVSGKQISSKNRKDLFHDETVSYSEKTNTLKIENAEITVQKVTDEISAGIYSAGALKIDVKGNNTITAKNTIFHNPYNDIMAGIYAGGELRIKGHKSSTLDIDVSTLVGPFAANTSYGILTENGGNLFLEHIILNAKSGAAVDSKWFTEPTQSAGIYADGNLNIFDKSEITATGNNARDSYGVFANREINVSDSSTLVATADSATDESMGILASELNVHDGSKVTGNGDYAVSGSYGINASEVNAYGKNTVVEGVGKASIGNSYGIKAWKVLAESGASITGKGGTARKQSTGIAANHIKLDGEGSITGEGGRSFDLSTGISLEDYTVVGDTGLTGNSNDEEPSYSLIITESAGFDAKITAIGGRATNVSAGVYAPIEGSIIKLNNGYLEAQGGQARKSYGIYSVGSISANSEKATIIASGADDSTETYGIFADNLFVDGGTVIGNGGYSVDKEVFISHGISVNNIDGINADIYGYAGDGASSVAYGIKSDTINVSNSKIIGKGGENTFYSIGIEADKIDAIQNSDLYGQGGSGEYSDGIRCMSEFTLSDSKLKAYAGEASEIARGLYTWDLTAEGKFNIVAGYDLEKYAEQVPALTPNAYYGIYNGGTINLVGPIKEGYEEQATVMAVSGDSPKLSCAIETETINVSGNTAMIAMALDGGEKSIGILGDLFAEGDQCRIYALANDAEVSYGLEGFLSAGDNSDIMLIGKTQALQYYEDTEVPFLDGRGAWVIYEYNPWDGVTDLRTYKHIHVYRTEGVYQVDSATSSWNKGSTSDAVFHIVNSADDDSTYENFVRLLLDGDLVSQENYTTASGSIYISLKPSFLETLSIGTHKLTAVFINGLVDSYFTIKEKIQPTPFPSGKTDSGKNYSNTGSSSVITCQMAGYPAGYEWNESAKACQPGYVDANGVFHAYTVQGRAKSPNTGDNGADYLWLYLLGIITSAGALLALNKAE